MAHRTDTTPDRVPDLRGRPGGPALHLHPQVRPGLRHRHHGPAGGPQRPPLQLHRHPQGAGAATATEQGIEISNLAPLFRNKLAEPYYVVYDYDETQQHRPIHLHHPLRPGVRHHPLRPAEGPGGGPHRGSQRGGQHPLQLLHPPRHDRRGRAELRVLRGGHLRRGDRREGGAGEHRQGPDQRGVRRAAGSSTPWRTRTGSSSP